MSLDVLSFGEILVDWVSAEPSRSLSSARRFEKAPGGAPANVAVALAHLGMRSGFAGGLSPDAFGRWLRSVLRRSGVDTTDAVEIEETDTRMAFILRGDGGERRLAAFTGIRAADAFVDVSHVESMEVGRATIFHFGSVTLASERSAAATESIVQRARDARCIISFDPNVRLALWQSADAAKRAIEPLLSMADILKVSDDEATLLTGADEPNRAGLLLMERYRPALLAVTRGARGARIWHGSYSSEFEGFEVEAVDTTGAGDAFVGGLLRACAKSIGREVKSKRRSALEALDRATIDTTLRQACALGALATTRMGAMTALPTLARLESFLASTT